MASVDINFVSRFVDLQRRLVEEFGALYPDAKDVKWLVDFPKRGKLKVGDEQWEFAKHGAGLRFTRQNVAPHIVVDIHKHIGEPNFVDRWRLVQFFESCGEDVDENEVASALNELCASGCLMDKGGQQYLLVRYGEESVRP